MYLDKNYMIQLLVGVALVASSDAFFLKWGSDSTQSPQKSWVQPLSPNLPGYRYQYSYSPYETRKTYQPQYSQDVMPIPISIPAGASLTPVSLQQVQLVPCMCPVAPEEADKLHEQLGPAGAGPYLAQTYPQPQPLPYNTQPTIGDTKTNTKQ